MNVLQHDGLENALLANWSKFLDQTKLMSFVLQSVRDQPDLTPVDDVPPRRSMQMTISRFAWTREGQFEVWLDFTVPTQRGTAVGTVESLLLPGGTLLHQRTTGVMFLQ